MSQATVDLIAIGGFPGVGKSSAADVLGTELRCPVLASDLFGNAIRGVLAEHGSDPALESLAFRAGYATLFALAEEIVTHRCSVIIDCSLGWQFQWDALDAIGRRTGVRLRPFILECSRGTCVARLQERHLRDPARHPPAAEFMQQPQLGDLRQLLDTIVRPDAQRLDAERPIAQICAEISQRIVA